MDKKLLENINRLGFTLMEPEDDFDVNKTLAEVVSSKDARLWEGFPVLLANAAKDYSYNKDIILSYLSEEGKTAFCNLQLLSLAIYQHYRLSFVWSNQLKNSLSDQQIENLKKMVRAISHDSVLYLNGKHISPDRLFKTFNNYFEKDAEETKQLKEKYEELSLEYALSKIFSPKQKELFKKKLKGEPFSKTEREYYSRVVKKKVSAIANPDLHRFAQKLMDY